MYKFLPHTADVKFRARGKTIELMFSEAAMALKQAIAEGIKVQSRIRKNISVEGKDNLSLLYNFLEEFLFLLDAENFLLGNIESIKIKDGKLTARISGDSASNYKFTNDVKAVTYNDMFVKKNKEWVCQVVLDV